MQKLADILAQLETRLASQKLPQAGAMPPVVQNALLESPSCEAFSFSEHEEVDLFGYRHHWVVMETVTP